MDESMAHPFGATRPVDLPLWKAVASHIAAVATAVLFLSAGIWKIMDPFEWRTRVEQLLVPYSLSLPATLSLGVFETLAGVLILVPRFRRWGAWLASLMLIVFMIYMGVNFQALAGKDCSCFPWMKRVIGSGFFIGDAVMLALSLIAGWWAVRSQGKRSAAVILGAIAVFSAVSYGVNAARLTGTKAPDTIVVEGQSTSLQHGRVFLYFYNPVCSHCFDAAKKMSTYKWGDTKVVGLATDFPQFVAGFLKDSGFKAASSPDEKPLTKIFPHGDPPYGVVLENGRQTGAITQWDGPEPEATLRKLRAIE